MDTAEYLDPPPQLVPRDQFGRPPFETHGLDLANDGHQLFRKTDAELLDLANQPHRGPIHYVAKAFLEARTSERERQFKQELLDLQLKSQRELIMKQLEFQLETLRIQNEFQDGQNGYMRRLTALAIVISAFTLLMNLWMKLVWKM